MSCQDTQRGSPLFPKLRRHTWPQSRVAKKAEALPLWPAHGVWGMSPSNSVRKTVLTWFCDLGMDIWKTVTATQGSLWEGPPVTEWESLTHKDTKRGKKRRWRKEKKKKRGGGREGRGEKETGTKEVRYLEPTMLKDFGWATSFHPWP